MLICDELCYEYRGRLSFTEVMNMDIGDIVTLQDFVRQRKELAAKAKEKEAEKDKSQKQMNKILNAAYRGHPQGGISGTPQGPSSQITADREDYAMLEDALEGLV